MGSTLNSLVRILDKSSIVYPDAQDAALLKDMTAAYKAEVLHDGIYGFGQLATAIYGKNFADILGASLKRASASDITAKASEALNQIALTMPQSTVAELRFMEDTIDRALSNKIAEVKSWMQENEFVNLDDVRRIAISVFDAKSAEISKKIESMKRDEAIVAAESLKSHPNFKDLPKELDASFGAIGIEAFYNTEVVIRKGKSADEPFSMLFLKDRNGKNGRIYATKEILKARFKAVFCSEVNKGDRKYGDATWVISASVKPEDIYAIVS